MTDQVLSPIEVQERLRRLQHAEDMASRASDLAARDELRNEIRIGWQIIKPYVIGRNIHAVSV
jgi:hypothetical protein